MAVLVPPFGYLNLQLFQQVNIGGKERKKGKGKGREQEKWKGHEDVLVKPFEKTVPKAGNLRGKNENGKGKGKRQLKI